MKKLLNFFEIPTLKFEESIRFYEKLLNTKLEVFDFGSEKMAFFAKDDSGFYGAISKAEGFLPSDSGITVYLNVDGALDETLAFVKQSGCKILYDKTKIESDGKGHFAIFLDPDGNRIGLHSY